MPEQPTVTVLVSRELLKQLGDWSEPVQVRIVETPGVGSGWEMEARTYDVVVQFGAGATAKSVGAQVVAEIAKHAARGGGLR